MRILVTGGSRGIGRACVERFCADGHEVAFIYRSDDAAAQALTERSGAIAIRADVSDGESAASAVNDALVALGGFDVLVNNAGIADFCLFQDVTDEAWRRMIDTNLSGAFYVARGAAKYMIANKFGRIINVGSMWGKTGAACEVHYSAAKAGLRGMTMALAKELGPSGVTVNCVEPGVIDTDMNKHFSQADKEEIAQEIPMGRFGKAEEVASVVSMLVEEQLYIGGEDISVTGGY